MTPARRETVVVFGSSDPAEGTPSWQRAYDCGLALAELGYAVANGGYGGTMEASARGAQQAGGYTIGVTCSLWSSRPSAACLSEIIETESYSQRLATLVELGTGGYVVLPGATGTLVEIAWVWEHACKKLSADRPIVVVGAFWQPLLEMMDAERPRTSEAVCVVEGAAGLAGVFGPASWA